MKHDKHAVRLLGGAGTVAIVFIPLFALASQPAIFFILYWAAMSYLLGFLIDKNQ